MKNMLCTRVPHVFWVASVIMSLAACGTIGDTGAVKRANELAINCETDQALRAIDRAARGSGLAGHIADLQRVVVLRDAGRVTEAKAALEDRTVRIGADADAAAEAERAISESIDALRDEREKRSGRRTCP